MTKSKVFFILSLGFIGGVFSASFYYPSLIDNYYLLILVLLAVIILAIFYKKPAMMAGFFILFFIFGIHLTEKRLEVVKNIKEDDFSGEVVVIGEPTISGRQQRMVAFPKIQPLEQLPRLNLGTDSRFLITAGIFPEYKYGDVLRVDCKLEIPKNFGRGPSTASDLRSDSAQDESSGFDYKMYLAKDGIYYLCNNPKIEDLNRNEGNKFYAAILNIKNKFNDNIMKLMPSPQSGLLSGLLIGGSGLLSKDYQNYFSLTGTTHIVAVSGYNVTIVAEYLMLLGLFIGLWRQQAFWFAAIGIIFFVILTGMPSSAVRAGVMGILLIWAMKNGRLANAQNAIIFAAGVMLLANPLSLRWDVGFQLSFLATLGIVYVYPIFNEYLMKLDAMNRVSTIAEILFLTLSAQVFVLPILMINFGKLSLISPLANVLILPIIPLTMLTGFIAILFSFIIPPIGQVFAWLAFLPLKYETMVIKFLASLKYSSVEISNFSWIGVVLWYIILGGGVVLIKKKITNPPLPLGEDAESSRQERAPN
ncbi:MAG: ComEC/Rec2 family competence protein [Parcubacteria group bacterium]